MGVRRVSSSVGPFGHGKLGALSRAEGLQEAEWGERGWRAGSADRGGCCEPDGRCHTGLQGAPKGGTRRSRCPGVWGTRAGRSSKEDSEKRVHLSVTSPRDSRPRYFFPSLFKKW